MVVSLDFINELGRTPACLHFQAESENGKTTFKVFVDSISEAHEFQMEKRRDLPGTVLLRFLVPGKFCNMVVTYDKGSYRNNVDERN